MSSVIGLKVRASILRTPGDNPGLLFLDGRQWPFTLDNVWKSRVAPSINMLVDVDFDGQGNITAITAVDPQQAAREKLEQIGDAAKERGKEATKIASQGIGALAAQMGKVTLAAAVILWIAWFFMPSLSISLSVFGVNGSRSISLWTALALDRSFNLTSFFNNADPGGSRGFLSLVVLAGMAAPFAVSLIKNSHTRYLYAAPLACVLLAWLTILYEFNQILDALRQQYGSMADDALKMSPDYGVFIIALASVVVAARVRRPAFSYTGSLSKPLAGAVVSSKNGFCPKCGKSLITGEEYCADCGAKRTDPG